MAEVPFLKSGISVLGKILYKGEICYQKIMKN